MTKQKRVLHLDKDPSLLQTLPKDLFWAVITLEQSYLGWYKILKVSYTKDIKELLILALKLRLTATKA